MVKIPHKADADSVLVVSVNTGVCSMFLFGPPEGGLYLAVLAIVTIADYKMISHPQPSEIVSMMLVEYVCVTGSGSAMMDDYVFPVSPYRHIEPSANRWSIGDSRYFIRGRRMLR